MKAVRAAHAWPEFCALRQVKVPLPCSIPAAMVQTLDFDEQDRRVACPIGTASAYFQDDIMYQNFESRSAPQLAAPRIARLRTAMELRSLDAWLVPHDDEYQNEYLPAGAERLAWITGFTGSAGFAIIARDSAMLFVDGRYTTQAGRQCDPNLFSVADLISTPPAQWLGQHAKPGWRVGFDANLTTPAGRRRFEQALAKAGAELVESENLVDAVWEDRPAPPLGRLRLHDASLAGAGAGDKLALLAGDIEAAGADAFLMCDPTSLAWAFNIRGNDVAHTPIVLGRAIIRRKGRPILFLEDARLGPDTRQALGAICDLREPQALPAELAAVAAGAKIWCDPDATPSTLERIVTASGGETVEARDPVVLRRAVKNPTEIAGARAAHLRDGVALTRFLAWLDRSQPGSLDEIAAARALERFRRESAAAMGSELVDISFDTISGAGANGAIVHYRVDDKTNAPLAPNTLYLVDSGGQYRDGTTDVTRTVAIGTPPAEARTDFTLVLKGHIAIATARFPQGTRGVDIDALARIALWRHGKDYAHGTGHGIGSFLSVHEGPQSISRRGMQALLPGMIVSNEPGYYRVGEYGIRIENLTLVTPAEPVAGGPIAVMGLETLTLAPIDRRLIDADLLNAEERDWLNAYHAHVRETLSPHLDGQDREWLDRACAPL